MYADNEFLIGMSDKLSEIAEKTIDIETKTELQELAESVLKACK